jgi:hypothetical protein
MPLMDIFKRFAPCSCMKSQTNEAGADVQETIKISVKTTCCRRTKIVNINVSQDIDALKDIKEIIDRLENNARAISRKNSGNL